MNETQDLTQIAIKEFINGNDNSKHTKVTLKEKNLRGSGFFSKSSRIINKNISKEVRSEIVADIKGTGELREITVVADTAINIILKVDGNNLFEGISQWSELNDITSYTDIITARVDGANYVFSLSKIRFTESLFLQVYFDSDANISSIFGIYDLFRSI